MVRSVATIKVELAAERKTARALRARIITHGGRKRAPKLWRSYQRHKATAADLKHELRVAQRRAHPPLRELAWREAMKLVGVMEVGGNNAGAEVAEIIRESYGQPSARPPWCGYTMGTCYRRAGSKLVDWRWGAVRLLSLIPGLGIVRVPKRGNLVRFAFDHVGMFVRWVDDNTIETIEGNTGSSGAVSDSKTGGDGVYRKHRSVALVKDFINVPR
jgi:hypothetical protein